MYICLCNGVTDVMILCEITKGNNTMEGITTALNVANICGSCQDEVQELLDKHGKPKHPFLNIVKID